MQGARRGGRPERWQAKSWVSRWYPILGFLSLQHRLLKSYLLTMTSCDCSGTANITRWKVASICCSIDSSAKKVKCREVGDLMVPWSESRKECIEAGSPCLLANVKHNWEEDCHPPKDCDLNKNSCQNQGRFWHEEMKNRESLLETPAWRHATWSGWCFCKCRLDSRRW